MKYLNLLKLIAALWPMIKEIVYSVEASFPDAGIGKVKLAEVLAILRSGWSSADISFDDAAAMLTAAIGTIVKLANLTGRFKSSDQAQLPLKV